MTHHEKDLTITVQLEGDLHAAALALANARKMTVADYMRWLVERARNEKMQRDISDVRKVTGSKTPFVNEKKICDRPTFSNGQCAESNGTRPAYCDEKLPLGVQKRSQRVVRPLPTSSRTRPCRVTAETPPCDLPCNLTVSEVAVWLGVSRDTVERRVKSGKFPTARKLGDGILRIPRSFFTGAW